MILAINTTQPNHELALIDGVSIASIDANAGKAASKNPVSESAGVDGLSIAENDAAKNTEAKILAEKTWVNQKNDVEDLVPYLQKMLEELGLEKTEITEVLVVAGPGPFTAIRIGLTFANILAEALGAKLYQMDTYELLKRKVATSAPVLAITNAGGLDIGVRVYSDATSDDESADKNKGASKELDEDKIEAKTKMDVKVGPMAALLAEFEHNKYTVVSEVTESQKTELHGICLEKGWKEVEGEKLQSLGEVILTFGLEGIQLLAKNESVDAIYLKDPVITKSKDPWKNR